MDIDIDMDFIEDIDIEKYVNFAKYHINQNAYAPQWGE